MSEHTFDFHDFRELENKRRQVEAEERNRQKVERLTRYFSRVNSALTFRNIQVSVESHTINAPAWSGASDIVLNSRLINDFNNGHNVANLRGLNFHELSHILYTPRNGTEIVTWVNDNKFRQAFNALEDQRIETLFTSRFPSTRDWFVVTVLTYFVQDEKVFATSYPLLRGRRYLPVEVREASLNAFPLPELIDEICEIVDEYRLLLYPRDTERAKELIERFHNLIKSAGTPDSHADNGNGQSEEQQVVDYNELADWEKELLKDLQKSNDSNQNSENKTKVLNCPMGHGERPTEGIESSVSSRPQPVKQQSRDNERAKQLDKSTPDEKQSQSQSQSQPQQGGKKAGTKSSSEILSTVINDILDKSEVAQEIQNIIRVVNGLPSLTSNNLTEPLKVQYQNVVADPKTLNASFSFGRELERLKAKFDPAWDKYESRGRLNARRFIRGDDLDTVFDTWNEGREDVTEIECVVILDNSGSMSGEKATQAYRAMFAIKSALDRINAKCSVITFNSVTNTLYQAREKAGNSIRDCGSQGGTEAEYAVRYATKLLAESEKPVKLFFAITDGEWSDTQVCDEEIRRMARAGVLTAFAYIPTPHERVTLTHEKAHYAEVGAVINNPFDLVGMARKIVHTAIARRVSSNA